MNDQKVKDFWDGRSKEHGKISNEAITLFGSDNYAAERDIIEKRKITSYLDRSRHKKILDLGCGVGRFTLFLADYADFVVGVDYSEPLLKIARAEARKKNIANIKFVCSDTSDCSFSSKFDLVLASGLLLYMDDVRAAKTISVIRRHLKHGGITLIKETISPDKRFEINEDVDAVYRTVAELEQMFRDAGFDILLSEKLYQYYLNIATWFFILK